jgi:ribosomal protein S10
MATIKNNVCFRIESYDVKTLRAISNFIQLYFQEKGVVKVTRLPSKRTIMTHNRSPHVYKLSQESFSYEERCWLIYISPLNDENLVGSGLLEQFLSEFSSVQHLLGEGSQIEYVRS